MVKIINPSRINLNFFADDRFSNMGDIIRICMTDHVTRPITDIVDGDLAPTDYAGLTVEDDFEIIFDFFFEKDKSRPRLSLSYYNNLKKKSPKLVPVFESYAYDQLTIAGILTRLSLFRNMDENSICTPLTQDNCLYASALLYLLSNTNYEFEQSLYSGITSFNKLAEFYIASYEVLCERMNVHFLTNFANAVGDLSEDKWILYDKHWGKVLINHTERLVIFRKFLFVALLYSTITEDTLERIYETNAEDIESDILEFMELREDPDTTYKDVLEFIKRIERHSQTDRRPMIFYTLFEAPFSAFEEQYNIQYCDESSPQLAFKVNPIQSIITSLENTLGERWQPDVIIEHEITPGQMIEYLITDCKDIIIDGPILDHYAMLGIDIPKSLDKNDLLFIGSVKDYLYLATAYIRYESIQSGSGFVNIMRKSHILLAMDDSTLGLSIMSWVLPSHVNINASTMTIDQVRIVYELTRSLDLLALAFPSMMNPSWKILLNTEVIRDYVRSYVFTVIESLYLKNEDEYKSYLKMTKIQWFDSITEFIRILREVPSQETILEFISKYPLPNQAVSINDNDGIIWTGSFLDLKDEI